MAARIEHSGVVERTERDTVYVRITSHSACGTCKAREACGLAEAQDKIVADVGALAVLLAVLVAAIAVLGWSEGRGALAALGAVGVYYCVLWLFRHKIEHTIHFSITKNY